MNYRTTALFGMGRSGCAIPADDFARLLLVDFDRVALE